jgi:hypothetical protein
MTLGAPGYPCYVHPAGDSCKKCGPQETKKRVNSGQQEGLAMNEEEVIQH